AAAEPRHADAAAAVEVDLIVVAEVEQDVAHQRIGPRMALRMDYIAVAKIILVMLGPLVAGFDFGPNDAEIVTGDQVAVDAELIVDGEDVEAVSPDVRVLQPHRSDLEPEVSGMVARCSWCGGKCGNRGRGKQIAFHDHCPCLFRPTACSHCKQIPNDESSREMLTPGAAVSCPQHRCVKHQKAWPMDSIRR